MSRMMDIGRPTHTNQSKPAQLTSETKVETAPELVEHVQTPIEPRSELTTDSPVAKPATINDAELPAVSAKPREIASYAIDDASDPKTFPLTQVLLTLGVIVVSGLIYLLLFV